MAKIEPISHLEQIIVDCFGGGSSSGSSSGSTGGSSTSSDNYKYYIYQLNKDIANNGFIKLSDTFTNTYGQTLSLLKTKENKIDYVCFKSVSIVSGYIKIEYTDGTIQEFVNRFNMDCTLTGANIKSITIGYDEVNDSTTLNGYIIVGESIQSTSSTKDKEFRYVDFSKIEDDTNFVADANGNYTYNLNNKTITNIKFTSSFSARSGSVTFVGKNDFVLKERSGFQNTELTDTNFTGITITKGSNNVYINGSVLLTLE